MPFSRRILVESNHNFILKIVTLVYIERAMRICVLRDFVIRTDQLSASFRGSGKQKNVHRNAVFEKDIGQNEV